MRRPPGPRAGVLVPTAVFVVLMVIEALVIEGDSLAHSLRVGLVTGAISGVLLVWFMHRESRS